MKFGEKYELLESLTTGGVETFVANDKVRGERVLVHILHCDPQKPNQPTVQWVLEAFRRVAPEPAGLVLEAGRYSGTLYAYIVSKLPEDAALQGWVRQYKAQAKDTQEFPRPIENPTPQSEAPTAEISSKEPERAPGPVTQLFRDFAPPAKMDARETPVEASPKEPSSPAFPQYSPQSPPQSQPKIGLGGESGPFRPADPWDVEAQRTPLSPRSELSGSIPVDSFRPDFAPKTFPSETINPPGKGGPKPGEFTSFFQGPFRGDKPSPTPSVSSQPMEPPRKNVGDFTAMFGPLKPQPEEPPPAAGIAGNEPAGTGFTGWFTPDMPSRMSSTTAPPMGLPRAVVDPASVVPEPLKEPPAPPPPPMSYVAPAPPIFPTPPMTPPPPPMVKLPVAAPSSLPSDGATRAFARPVIEPPAGPPPPPSGPSAYTQVISLKAMNPAGDAAGKPSPGKAAPPAFAAPSMPSLPAVAPPPMPAIAAPALPKLPKAPKVTIPEPPVSYWPLIVTLTVLFFVAVLLVLFLVLKH
jgi:hypothetical protein